MLERTNKYVLNDKKQWSLLKERANSMRKTMTKAELLIWDQIKSDKLGIKFRRQYIIENYIADFANLSHKIIIEIDGDSHINSLEYDNHRTDILKIYGFNIIRFNNDEIYNNLDIVILKLKEIIKLLSPSL
jgi:very-short-patch-repair endonuclease